MQQQPEAYGVVMRASFTLMATSESRVCTCEAGTIGEHNADTASPRKLHSTLFIYGVVGPVFFSTILRML
jgi:hypothetical protein